MRHLFQRPKSFPVLFGSLAALALLAPSAASALTVSLVPSNANPNVGTAFSLSVVASGFDPAQWLGAFEFTATYSSLAAVTQVTILPSFNAIGSGSTCPLAGDPVCTQSVLGPTTRQIDFAGVSFSTPAQLALQLGSSFTLATLTFSAAGAGADTFTLGAVALSGATGSNITGTAALVGTIVNIAAVPEPESLSLFAMGLAGLGAMWARRSRASRT